jgi:methionyl-tRNA formyltransferase
MIKPKLGLYLRSARGLSVLVALLREVGAEAIGYVVAAADSAVEKDDHREISEVAKKAGVPVWTRNDLPARLPPVTTRFAAGWRWLLPEVPGEPLVVFHDSLLPSYRGFAPLVTALIARETTLGVTALFGASEYDAGPILRQETVAVSYPLRISEAIEAVRPCYEKLAVAIWQDLVAGSLNPRPQDPKKVSYSLWRDEEDYLIDWGQDAATVRRFVDATGDPYRGAATFAAGKKLRVLEVTERPDVEIGNRAPGKLVFLEHGRPTIVCGRGLVRIEKMVDDQTRGDALPWTRFRTRFTGGGV